MKTLGTCLIELVAYVPNPWSKLKTDTGKSFKSGVTVGAEAKFFSHTHTHTHTHIYIYIYIIISYHIISYHIIYITLQPHRVVDGVVFDHGHRGGGVGVSVGRVLPGKPQFEPGGRTDKKNKIKQTK